MIRVKDKKVVQLKPKPGTVADLLQELEAIEDDLEGCLAISIFKNNNVSVQFTANLSRIELIGMLTLMIRDLAQPGEPE